MSRKVEEIEVGQAEHPWFPRRQAGESQANGQVHKLEQIEPPRRIHPTRLLSRPCGTVAVVSVPNSRAAMAIAAESLEYSKLPLQLAYVSQYPLAVVDTTLLVPIRKRFHPQSAKRLWAFQPMLVVREFAPSQLLWSMSPIPTCLVPDSHRLDKNSSSLDLYPRSYHHPSTTESSNYDRQYEPTNSSKRNHMLKVEVDSSLRCSLDTNSIRGMGGAKQ